MAELYKIHRENEDNYISIYRNIMQTLRS